MFYHVLYPLHAIVPGLNVFRYLTFRTAYAILTGLILSLILGPWVIRQLRRYQIGETIREDGPKSHLYKAGTPTMGGILILIALSIPTVLWGDLTNRYLWLLLSATFAFGAIGFVDDWLKLAGVRRQGMRIGEKLLSQTVVACGLASFMYFYPEDRRWRRRSPSPSSRKSRRISVLGISPWLSSSWWAPVMLST